jgi:hypothetical protein
MYKSLGKEYCTKSEFMGKFLTDEVFLKQYKKWQKSEYQRKSAPSIDRINEDIGYTIDNLQFLSNIENARKYSSVPVLIIDINTTDMVQFRSMTEASKYIGCSIWDVSNSCRNGKLIKHRYKGELDE